MKRNCDHALEYVYHYLDEEITWYHRVRVRWHLRRCADCCNGFDFERKVQAMVRTKGIDEPPPELYDRLRTLMREHGADDLGTQ